MFDDHINSKSDQHRRGEIEQLVENRAKGSQTDPATMGPEAMDQSPQALALAERNIKVHQLEGAVELRQGSWWEPLADCAGTLALVVSNPPYIPTAVWAQLEAGVRDHEPSLALDGGADGLDAIRRIAAGAIRHLAPGGWLLLEHHHDQSSAVLALLRAAGLEQVQAHRDLEGVWRFASGRRPGATP